MSDLHRPCEDWAEAISLAAAGCLSSGEEREVRQHLDVCAECRGQYRQLVELCRSLAEAPLIPGGSEAEARERIMLVVSAEVASRPIDRRGKEVDRSQLRTTSLDTWRRIMRYPASRISAAAVFALAIIGLTVWFSGGGTTPAFANFIEPILSAKTVTFKTTFEGGGQKITGKVMGISSPQRMRMEQDLPNNQKTVTISDATRSVTLQPSQKVAIVTTFSNVSKEKAPKAIFFELKSQLADARDQPDWIRERLGEKVIEGKRLTGFRLTGHGLICDLWGDPKTGMPVRIESSSPSNPSFKPMIYSDFVFNANLDESLFSLEPPADYQVRKLTVDVSPAREEDLIETLRRYAQLRDGALPDQLDINAFTTVFQEDWAKSHPKKKETPSEEEMRDLLNGLLKFTRGLSFAFEQLPRESDAHYAGKGVKLGAADTPVFWYRSKDAKTYRIIQADLSVREAATPPNVPNAQPVVSASGPGK